MMELLAPAGSRAAALAALRAGADAVYLGMTAFSARAGAENFAPEALEEICAEGAEKGVKVYLTLNTMMTDKEIEQVQSLLPQIAGAGISGIIVQDIGLARRIHEQVPSLPLHASTQMAVHSLAGVRFLQKQGYTRVVLARELSLAQIREITQNTDIETEVFVHGALCMSYSGHCYLSAVIGRKSGNRGRCAQPCRLPWQNEKPLLSLKDLSLIEQLDALQDAGVHTLKIEGRLKSPEYVSIVTRSYADVLRGKAVTEEMKQCLSHIFSRQGFTDGYFTNRIGENMFGIKLPTAFDDYQATVAADKALPPFKRFSFSVTASLREGQPSAWEMSDGTFSVQLTGSIPQPAKTLPLSAEALQKQMEKTNDTAYQLKEVSLHNPDGLFLPASACNEMRREGLAKLDAKRRSARPYYEFKATAANLYSKPSRPLSMEAFFYSINNLPDFSALSVFTKVWLPAHRLPKALPQNAGIWIDPFLTEEELMQQLCNVKERGITNALCANIGQIEPLQQYGFTISGDTGLNIANSHALQAVKSYGFSMQYMSFEMMFSQIKHLQKPLPIGVIAYGRLPLMRYKNCVIKRYHPCVKQSGFTPIKDRTGTDFLLQCRPQCGNLLLNSQPLILSDKTEDILAAEISTIRLDFSDESTAQVIQIIEQYKKHTPPSGKYTRGLYYRGVL